MPVKDYPFAANRHLLFDSGNRPFTVSLFEETSPTPSATTPLFKLADWKREYLAICDPTEYRAALSLIGDWSFWLRLRESSVLGPLFDSWKREVELKLRSLAVSHLVSQASSPNGTAAAKWLAEGGFTGRELRGGGGKTTKAQAEEDAVSAQVRETIKKVQDDAKRLGIHSGR